MVAAAAAVGTDVVAAAAAVGTHVVATAVGSDVVAAAAVGTDHVTAGTGAVGTDPVAAGAGAVGTDHVVAAAAVGTDHVVVAAAVGTDHVVVAAAPFHVGSGADTDCYSVAAAAVAAAAADTAGHVFEVSRAECVCCHAVYSAEPVNTGLPSDSLGFCDLVFCTCNNRAGVGTNAPCGGRRHIGGTNAASSVVFPLLPRRQRSQYLPVSQ